MRKYKAILFDFDGSVADTAPGIYACAEYAANSFGIEVKDKTILSKFVGPPLLDSFDSIFGLKGEDGVAAVKKYRELYRQGEMFNLMFYPGIIELFKELKEKNIKTGICSSKPEKFIRQIIEHFDSCIEPDVISCPRDDGEKEPKSLLISRACETLGIETSEALMVGDRYLDIEGAVISGADSCGVLYGYGSPEEFKTYGATYTAENVNDVRLFALSEL